VKVGHRELDGGDGDEIDQKAEADEQHHQEREQPRLGELAQWREPAPPGSGPHAPEQVEGIAQLAEDGGRTDQQRADAEEGRHQPRLVDARGQDGLLDEDGGVHAHGVFELRDDLALRRALAEHDADDRDRDDQGRCEREEREERERPRVQEGVVVQPQPDAAADDLKSRLKELVHRGLRLPIGGDRPIERASVIGPSWTGANLRTPGRSSKHCQEHYCQEHLRESAAMRLRSLLPVLLALSTALLPGSALWSGPRRPISSARPAMTESPRR
jgi:hypothetical protein